MPARSSSPTHVPSSGPSLVRTALWSRRRGRGRSRGRRPPRVWCRRTRRCSTTTSRACSPGDRLPAGVWLRRSTARPRESTAGHPALVARRARTTGHRAREARRAHRPAESRRVRLPRDRQGRPVEGRRVRSPEGRPRRPRCDVVQPGRLMPLVCPVRGFRLIRLVHGKHRGHPLHRINPACLARSLSRFRPTRREHRAGAICPALLTVPTGPTGRIYQARPARPDRLVRPAHPARMARVGRRARVVYREPVCSEAEPALESVGIRGWVMVIRTRG